MACLVRATVFVGRRGRSSNWDGRVQEGTARKRGKIISRCLLAIEALYLQIMLPQLTE